MQYGLFSADGTLRAIYRSYRTAVARRHLFGDGAHVMCRADPGCLWQTLSWHGTRAEVG